MNEKRFTALQAFELLLKCVEAKRAPSPGLGKAYEYAVGQKDKALDAVIGALGTELRRVLSPALDDVEPDSLASDDEAEKARKAAQ